MSLEIVRGFTVRDFLTCFVAGGIAALVVGVAL